MDYSKIFSDSFKELNKHKVLVIPVLFSMLITFFLVFWFLSGTGILAAATAATLAEERALERLGTAQHGTELDRIFAEAATQDQVDREVSRAFIGELPDKERSLIEALMNGEIGFSVFLAGLIDTPFFLWLIIFGILTFLVHYYFSCASFAMITLSIRKRAITFHDTFILTNRYVVKFITLHFLLFLVFYGPLSAWLLIVGGLFLVNPLAAIPLLPLTLFIVLGYLVYLIFMHIRFFFAEPLMFVEEKPIVQSMRISFQIAKGHLFNIFLLLLVMYGISYIVGQVSPFQYEVVFSLLSFDVLSSVVTVIVFVLVLALETIALTFRNIFLFYSYVNFKETDVKDHELFRMSN